jgi:hypothetical protein
MIMTLQIGNDQGFKPHSSRNFALGALHQICALSRRR